MDERQLVLERMQELEGWAAYIVDALPLDQKTEPVGLDMLKRSLEERTLR